MAITLGLSEKKVKTLKTSTAVFTYSPDVRGHADPAGFYVSVFVVGVFHSN